MNKMYAVYFHSIIAKSYRTQGPAIFFDKEKAVQLAMEMNDCGAGGYTVETIEIKKAKKTKI